MILFLDTVSPLPTFTVIKDNKIIHSIHILDGNSNKISDRIIPAFLELQKKSCLDEKIKKLVVCTGPGSYTSLRVGIAFMYGISYSRKIPLIGITCFDLFRYAMPKSNVKNTLMFICSSNDQNFISLYSNQDNKYLIKKLDYRLQSTSIDYNMYNYSISNQKLPLNIIKTFNLNNHREINLAEVVKINLKNITSLSTNNIIKPIYISDNKILN